jgi:hypothetical protein
VVCKKVLIIRDVWQRLFAVILLHDYRKSHYEWVFEMIDIFLVKSVQLAVDTSEFGVHLKTLSYEFCFDATHAQVLNVKEHKQSQ